MVLKYKFRRFVARYFGGLVELYFRLYSSCWKFSSCPIIVLTPGKVASSSVYSALKYYTNAPVFHIHRISQEGIESSSREHLDSDRKSRPLHLIISKILRNKLANYQGKIYVITIIREPISRFISSFFQNTEFYKNEIEMYNLQIDEQKTLELLRLQLKNDPTIELEEWFDNEIKNPFGIDVYKNIFDCNKGYQIINNNRCHHLLIRMENLNHCFSSAIQEFLNIDKSVNIKNVNIGENKYYANSYNRIKSEIRLELEVMEKVVSSRYFQHFYPEQEEIVRDKWLVKN